MTKARTAIRSGRILFIYTRFLHILVELVSIMFSLIRAIHRNTDISSLRGSQLRELHADLLQMQAGHLFVEMLRQAVNIYFVLLVEEFDLDRKSTRLNSSH